MERRIHPAILAVLCILGTFLAAPIGFAAFGATPAKEAVIVINSGYRLVIDSEKGTIASLRSTYGLDHELLIPGHTRLPLFKIEFMNDHAEFKTVTSSEAKMASVKTNRDAEGETITIDYEGIGQLPVDAHVTVRCPSRQSLTYWTLAVNNRTSMWIGHIQFPVIEIPFDNSENHNHSHILSSFADGSLSGSVEPSMGTAAWGENALTLPKSGDSTTILVSGLQLN